MQNKNLWFCPNTEDKKVIVNNSIKSVILLSYTDVKDKLVFQKHSSNLFFIIKKICPKICSQFHIPQTNTYTNMFTVIFSLFNKNDILKTRLHFLHIASFRMN